MLVRIWIFLLLVIQLEELLPDYINRNSRLIKLGFSFSNQSENIFFGLKIESKWILDWFLCKQGFYLLIFINLHFLETESCTFSHRSGGGWACSRSLSSFWIFVSSFIFFVFLGASSEFDSLFTRWFWWSCSISIYLWSVKGTCISSRSLYLNWLCWLLILAEINQFVFHNFVISFFVIIFIIKLLTKYRQMNHPRCNINIRSLNNSTHSQLCMSSC